MDKQQATDFIIERLNLGYGEDEIAAELSKRLGAPPEIVKRFVGTVAADFPSPPPPIPEPAVEPVAQPPDSQPPFVFDDDDEEYYPEDKSYYKDPDPQYEQPQPDSFQQPTPEDDLTYQPESEGEGDPGSGEEEIVVDLDLLTVDVLKAIKKHHRHNDIVEMVCHRTGWHWNKSQRFVARTQTEHHQDLSKSQNRFMIPFSAIFILGGVLLFLWSAMSLLDYYRGFTDPGYVNTFSTDLLPLVVGAFFTSFGIIAGGIYGLYRTLTANA